MRKAMANVRKFHRWPRYEVLELLSNDEEGLYGFTVHISNGTQCTFERHKDRVIAQNVMFEEEGLSLQIGSLDDLKKEWLVRGEPYREPMDRNRYNADGEWKPIVYPGPTDHIHTEIGCQTQDQRIQGCLFYVMCTGQAVIEFFAKGNLDIGLHELILPNRLRLYRCDWLTHEDNKGKICIYDGTMPLKGKSVNEVRSALEEIGLTLDKLAAKRHADISWDLKYKMSVEGPPGKENEDGTFTVTLNFSDPRNLLVVSHENLLPTTDWKMKVEWTKHHPSDLPH
jgi:hypothetical protein